jgi:hypothetical protein
MRNTGTELNAVFTDLRERNDAERKRLEARRALLERREDDETKLPPPLAAELAELKVLTAKKKDNDEEYVIPVVDPLFLATLDILKRTSPGVKNVKTLLHRKLDETTDGEEQLLTAVLGILASDNVTATFLPRTFKKDGTLAWPPTPDERFAAAVARAVGEFGGRKALFVAVLPLLVSLGKNGELRASAWAGVTRALAARSIPAGHPNLAMLVQGGLADELGGDEDSPASSIEIDLPDIDAEAEAEIIPSNLRAMQALYFASMLENANFFDTGDKLEELFLNQMLPLGRGPGGEKIYRRWKRSTQRITKAERLSLAARAFGFPGGDPSIQMQNREFSDLWLRFVSAVSEYTRKMTVDDLLRTRTPLSVSTEQVRKSGRDLAANLSLHGYGIAYFAATELQNEINDILDILRDPEVRAAYGARDWRQVVEQVSVFELGGAKNIVRSSTMATSGAIIIRWLAENSSRLSGVYQPAILDTQELLKPSMRPLGVKATIAPTDRDLVDACEQWLAVTGTSDQRVEDYSQPSETPIMTTRPVQIPQVAKDLLDSVGISAGYGGGNGVRSFAGR